MGEIALKPDCVLNERLDKKHLEQIHVLSYYSYNFNRFFFFLTI